MLDISELTYPTSGQLQVRYSYIGWHILTSTCTVVVVRSYVCVCVQKQEGTCMAVGKLTMHVNHTHRVNRWFEARSVHSQLFACKAKQTLALALIVRRWVVQQAEIASSSCEYLENPWYLALNCCRTATSWYEHAWSIIVTTLTCRSQIHILPKILCNTGSK